MSVETLLEWAMDNGAVVSEQLSFMVRENGVCGVKKSGKFAAPQIVLPRKLMITSDVAREFLQSKGIPSIDGADSNLLIKFFLCYVKFSGTGSTGSTGSTANNTVDFSQYINLLPYGTTMTDSPLIWPLKDKKLLGGTNLGASLDDKLISLIEEWHGFAANYSNNVALEFYDTFFKGKSPVLKLSYLRLPEFDAKIKKISQGTVDYWLSFEAFLWAHLMVTSRSFPRKVVDTFCPENEILLLPVIDLLNHKLGEEVEWGNDNGFTFSSKNFDALQEVEEVYNNYGLKNSEELLLGYGFLIADNEYDTYSLKLKLPGSMLDSIAAEHPLLKLPVPSDYSVSSSSSSATGGSKYSDGLLYFLSRKNPIPQELLELFCAVHENELDKHFIQTNKVSFTSRTKLFAINNLMVSIEAKHDSLGEIETSKETKHSSMVAQYRKSQSKVLKASLKHLKKLLKETIQANEAKGTLLTLKKVLNKDKKFKKAVSKGFGGDDSEFLSELVSSTEPEKHQLREQLLILWLIRCSNKNKYPEYREAAFDEILPSAIFNIFLWFKIYVFKTTQFEAPEVDQAKSLAQLYFPKLSEEAPEVFGCGSWGYVDFLVADRVMELVKYSRVGKLEEMIVWEED